MPEMIFVLWLYWPLPWNFRGVDVSPGWASWSVFDEREACDSAASRFVLRDKRIAAMCLPAGKYEPRPVAEPIGGIC